MIGDVEIAIAAMIHTGTIDSADVSPEAGIVNHCITLINIDAETTEKAKFDALVKRLQESKALHEEGLV